MNIKKLFAVLAGVTFTAQTLLPVGVMWAEYSQELQDAYDWAYGKGVTTMSPIDNANMYGAITRSEMAKMLSVYATEVLGNTPDTSKACTFTDIDSVKWDLHDFIIESCQLGIMGQGITAFRPYDTISRAEFGTALSRVLWGDKYEGGTPYYANHLNALKSAAIMNQIANAESTKEIRGYVMLMLMRSEGGSNVDCEDPAIALACLDPELDVYKDCPAACREDANKDEDAKSGDITVSVSEGDGYVVSKGVTSYIDTIDFKASEDITLDSITLERFGYSTTESVNQVWLEDADGNEITNRKSMSSTKDTVTLSLKKDYRNIGTEAHLTIGLTTADKQAKDLWKSIWFKVVGMESSAANVELPTKDANLYDIIDYEGSEVLVQFKGTNKTYNVKDGEFYEVAKVRVRATNAAIDINGLVLTNDTADASDGARYLAVAPALKELDLADFVEDVEVYADGKLVDNVKYSIKRDELNLSFDKAINVAINKDVDISVKVSLKDFDDYGDGIRFVLEEDSNLKAVESKTNTVVKLQNTSNFAGKAYIFEGGKINIEGKKLSSPVKWAQWAQDVVFWEGDVTVGEAVRFDITVTPTWKTVPTNAACAGKAEGDTSICTINTKPVNAISRLSILVDKNEYELSYDSATQKFSAKDVEIDKDATVKFVVDIADYEEFQNGEIQFTPALFKMAGAKYESNNEPVGTIVGNINLYPVKVQAGEGSLKNDISGKTVQFKAGDGTVTKNIFEWTYSAKKQKVNLKSVELVKKTANWPVMGSTTDATFNVKINGNIVATLDLTDLQAAYNKDAATDLDTEISLNPDEEVTVVVEAKINADINDKDEVNTYTLYLIWEDDNGAEAGTKSKDTADLKIVAAEAMNVTTESSMRLQDIVLTEKNQSLAKFKAKPANSASSSILDDLVFEWTTALNTPTSMSSDDFDVLIDWKDAGGDVELSADGKKLTVSNIGKEIDKNGVTVELVYADQLVMGEYTTKVTKVNATLATAKEFKRLALPFKFAVVSQANNKDSNQTEYKFDLLVDDDANVNYISHLTLSNTASGDIADWDQDIEDGTTKTYYADDLEDARDVEAIAVTLDGVTYTITKADAAYTSGATTVSAGWYKDLFTVTNSSQAIKVFAKTK